MTRKVTQIKYIPLERKVEFSHSDGSKTVYAPKIPSQCRLETLPYHYLTSFWVCGNTIVIYINKQEIKINWQ
jgi:hypothetical protein